MKTIKAKYDSKKEWKQDPRGYFLIRINRNQIEVAHVKKRYMFDLDTELDDPYKQVVRYAFPHLYSKEIYIEEEREQVKAISREEIIEISRKTFVAEKLNLILVGPYTPELKKELEKLIINY